MDFTSRYWRTISHLRSQWPTYLLGYGGGILLLVTLTVISIIQRWYSFVILALVGLLVLAYFLGVSLWAYHALHDNHSIRDTLYQMGELAPTMTVVDINLGRREFPVALSRRMTTGRIVVLDVYNPLLAPSRALARAHDAAERPVSDPRLSWRDGGISLLPLPDDSVPAVTLVQVASELWQEGDRLRLLREINRVLQPGGTLLISERVRTPINLLVSGPAGLRLSPAAYWLELVERSDFKIRQTKSIGDLIMCLRVDKRQEGEARLLPVDL
jgi:SAM-dependent methyltransferase